MQAIGRATSGEADQVNTDRRRDGHARHSGAENLWIVIERHGAGFRIRAHDDGRGSSDDARDGFGLRGMRARLESSGGELRIDPNPERGFDVVALVR